MLQHYVFLKYREETSDGHIAAFCERMLACAARSVKSEHLEIGRDELHDARSWDLVLIMEFASVDALRAYQRHPDTWRVMAFNEPFVANVASVDFTQARERNRRQRRYRKEPDRGRLRIDVVPLAYGRGGGSMHLHHERHDTTAIRTWMVAGLSGLALSAVAFGLPVAARQASAPPVPPAPAAGQGPTQTPSAPQPGAPAGQPGRGGRGGTQGTPVLGPNGEVWGFTDTAFNPGIAGESTTRIDRSRR